MLTTDFIDYQTGERKHIEDGKDQVIAVSTKQLRAFEALWYAKENEVEARRLYYSSLDLFERSWQNLHLTVAQFDKLAQAVYAESSGDARESYGIVNVLENRAAADGTDLITQVNDAPGYGVYGVRSNRYFTEEGAAADEKRRNVHIGIARAIPGQDITNGAYYWQGVDLAQRGSNAYNGYYLVGLRFTSPSHNIWNLPDCKSGNRAFDYKFETTAVAGKTTFMRLTSEWMKAVGAHTWRGTRR